MKQAKKVITIILTLMGILFEIITIPIGFIFGLIFYKKLQKFNEENRKIFLTSLSTYLVYFVITLILGATFFYLNRELLKSFFIERSFLLIMLVYLLWFSAIFRQERQSQIVPNNIFRISQGFMILIITGLVAMIFLGVYSKELWAKFFDFLKILMPFFVIPVFGLIKTQNISLKWKYFKIIVITYFFFLTINFSRVIGSIFTDIIEIIRHII